VDFIDAVILDKVICPPDVNSQIFSEKKLYMSRHFTLFTLLQSEYIKLLPRKESNEIVIGSTNKNLKHSPELLQTWNIILKAVPSVKILIIIDEKHDILDRITYYSDKLECDVSRIYAVPFLHYLEFSKVFSQFDILLDTFPYSGITNAYHALIQSVPVVTMYNPHYIAHNTVSSLLTHAGLDEFVTHSVDEYVSKVVSLCNSPERLKELRGTNITDGLIYQKSQTVMDPKAFIDDYEATLISALTGI